MQPKRKIQKQPDWRFTLEQIGPGLRTFYPTPENLPPGIEHDTHAVLPNGID
jgi:hypothetical protein